MRRNLITKAVELAGSYSAIARQCGVNYKSVIKWEQAGRLPKTELLGITKYAPKIAALCGDDLTADDLIEWTAAGWNVSDDAPLQRVHG